MATRTAQVGPKSLPVSTMGIVASAWAMSPAMTATAKTNQASAEPAATAASTTAANREPRASDSAVRGA